MTTPTTDQVSAPTPTAAERLAAAGEMDTIDKQLRELPEWAPNRAALATRKLELAKVRFAPTPEAALAKTWRDHQQHRQEIKALRAEMEEHPYGSPLRNQILEEVAQRTAEFHRGDPVPGTFTAGDVRKLAGEAMTDDEYDRFANGARALGVGEADQVEWLRVTKLTAGREPTDSELAEAEGLLVKHADAIDRALAPLPPADRSRLLNSFEHPQRLRVFLDAIRRAALK